MRSCRQQVRDRSIEFGRVPHDARLGDANAVADELLRTLLIESRRADLGTRSAERNVPRLEHPLHGPVLSDASVQTEEDERIFDGQRVERLLESRKDRGTRRQVVDLERPLVREQIRGRNVVYLPVRRPEPRQHAGKRAHDVLRRGNADVALVGRTAEEDDDRGIHGVVCCKWIAGC